MTFFLPHQIASMSGWDGWLILSVTSAKKIQGENKQSELSNNVNIILIRQLEVGQKHV